MLPISVWINATGPGFVEPLRAMYLENGKCTVGYSRCRWNLRFGNFTLSLRWQRHRIVSKRVPHDYFSSFIQSDHCFLPLPLPKLAILPFLTTPTKVLRELSAQSVYLSKISFRNFADTCQMFFLLGKGPQYAEDSLLQTAKAQEVRNNISTYLGKPHESVWVLSRAVQGSMRSTHRGRDGENYGFIPKSCK